MLKHLLQQQEERFEEISIGMPNGVKAEIKSHILQDKIKLLEAVVGMCGSMKNTNEMEEMGGIEFTRGYENALSTLLSTLQAEIKEIK